MRLHGAVHRMIGDAAGAQGESLSAYMTEAALMRAAWEAGHAAARSEARADDGELAYLEWRAELSRLRAELERLN